MTSRVKVNPFSIVPQLPIWEVGANAPAAWSMSQIIYKKITFSTTTDGLQIFYHTDSYSVSGNAIPDITTFVNNILSYNYTKGLSKASPLNFSIYGSGSPNSTARPGYMVFELNRRANWYFRGDYSAVTTGDPNNGNSANPEYFNLMHVPNSGAAAQTAPVNAIYGCNIVYFSFISPSANGSITPKATPDPFNLYATVQQADGSLLDITLDPDITNTGGPPPSQLMG